MTLALLLLAAFTVCFSLVAKRLETTILTAPMLFLGAGYAISQLGVVPEAQAESVLHLVAEVALILLLFLDAAQTNLNALRRDHAWPVRMLSVGLPAAVILGALMLWPLLPGWPLVAVALLAAILAPTDAALGQAVIANPVVPERARRTITVESGLNDGLALPAILFLASLVARTTEGAETDWLLFAASQLVLGPLVGGVAGLIGGKMFLAAKDRGLSIDTYEGIGAIGLAGGIYLAATAVDGNGFIAAFMAGLCFGNAVRGRCKFVYEFTENEGRMLSWGAFFLIGLSLLPDALAHLTPETGAIIFLSLFVIRPVSIWISLLGTKTSPTTRLFFGWFGPRGLATALFTLLVVRDISPDYGAHILAIAINMVWISAVLHGISATPGARWYAARLRRQEAGADETMTEPVGTSAKPLLSRDYRRRN